MGRQNLLKDSKGNELQAFVADPLKSQVPQVITTTLALSTILDLPEIVAIAIYSDTAITRYFGTASTKTFPVPANQLTIIMLDEGVTEIVLTGAATVSIEAM